MEKDEVIPRKWLEKMDQWQHALESSIKWDQGDILIIDVSSTSFTRLATRRSSLMRHTEQDSILPELRGTTRPLGLGR